MADAIPPEVLEKWERFGALRYRSKRETIYPCAVCGWGQHMAIHQPITEGTRAGQPHGHAYEPYGVRVLDGEQHG